MDVLNVGEKKYIKATTLAKRFAYTADYIGQLCRLGKVEAQLVGRSWYVEEESLKSHKNDRYRTTQVKSLKSIREASKQVGEIEENHKQEHQKRSHFYVHSRLKAVKYHEDQSSLIPLVTKPTHRILTVDLAESQKVSVSSQPEQFVFNTPSVPKIQFKGSLKITDIEDVPVSSYDGSTHLHPTEVSNFKHHKSFKYKAISTKPVVSDSKAVHLVAQSNDDVVYSHITKSTFVTPQNSIVILGVYIFCISLALAFVFLLFTLELEIAVTTNSIIYSYMFSFDHVAYLLSK